MSKQLERHDISDELYVYKQDNSERWYARIKVAGKWHAKATKQKEKEKAIGMAYRLQADLNFQVEHNILASSKRFRDVAEKAIRNMQEALDNNTGIANYKHYIQVLRKYHIPFFDRTYITSIDADKLRQFDNWRMEQHGKQFKTSTLRNHNAAMQLVFKEAVDKKWMLAAQVPSLSTKGAPPERRNYFTPEEFDTVICTIFDMIDYGRAGKTRQIRELLLRYVFFAVDTGIRPGTEMEKLTWGDVRIENKGHKARAIISVREGKTIKNTGVRVVYCGELAISSLTALRHLFPHRKPKDKLFRLEDGSTTNQLGNTFNEALKTTGLKNSQDGVRTLYSLRHTYMTWKILQKTPLEVLSVQCGTSIAMIEEFYNHLTTKMYANMLSGVDLDEEDSGMSFKPYVSREPDEETKQLLADGYQKWQEHYKKYGCI